MSKDESSINNNIIVQQETINTKIKSIAKKITKKTTKNIIIEDDAKIHSDKKQQNKSVKSTKSKTITKNIIIEDDINVKQDKETPTKSVKKSTKSTKSTKSKLKDPDIEIVDEINQKIILDTNIQDILSKNGSVLSKNGYVISKKTLTKSQLDKIKQELNVKPKIDDSYGVNPESFTVYKEDDDNIIIPKYYGIKKFGKPVETYDLTNSKVDFEFSGKLRGTQVDVAKAVLEKLQSKGGGLLQLHTGYGKTTMAIYIASVLKLKTLVVVHKTFLQDQWYDRIKQFTNASIGMIRQKKVDVEGKDIVIGMLQSISMIDYDPEIFKDFQLVICDECLPTYTKVMTNEGYKTIGQLYNLWKNNSNLPLIQSYNEQTQCFEFKKLTYAWEKETDLMVQINLSNKKIECTPNHKFLTTKGYIEAQKLTTHHIILGSYESNAFAKALNNDQFQIILGSYLGDGNLHRPNSRYILRIRHGIHQKEYCEWKASMFNCKTTIIEKNGYAQTKAICFATKIFDLEDNLPDRKTSCPQWVIDKLDYRGIAIWIMDDGSLNKKSPIIRISTCSFDENTQQRLVEKFKKMGINSHYYKCKKGYYYIEINEQGTKKLILEIYPYIHESMKCKNNCDNYVYNIHDQTYKYQWNNKFLNYGTCRVTSIANIEVTKENKLVYDIEVENNHNFVVSGKHNDIRAIVHNCHHFSSRVFSKALLKICPRYTIGLSATPHRLDGLMKVVKWFLGDILVKVERKGDNAVYIKSFDYKSNDKLYEEKKRWIPGSNQAKPDTVKMITNMYKMKNRNKFVTNIINGLRKKDERKTLVLSGRIEHLKILKEAVDALIAIDVIQGLCYQDEIKTAFYIGGMKDYQLKDAAEADIIFATYSMAEEGLDIDGLNTLVLATPKKNIIQSIGRIMRKPIEEGDVNPLIIDIIDDLSCFKSWGDKRIKYYKSKKYTVSSYKSFNDDVISYKDYMIKEGILNKEDVTPDFDPRKHYILTKYGKDTYKFEKRLEFENFPNDMFNYSSDYVDIFEINHDYTKNTQDEQKIEIDFDPKIEIEI